MSSVRVALAAAAAVTLLAGVPAAARDTAPTAVVDMAFGFKFKPAEVRIRVGQTVEWRNKSFATHTVTFDPAKSSDTAMVSLPPGVEPFDSGPVAGGQTWRHTFTVPGTYRYICVPHRGEGLTGTVIVAP